MFSHKIKIIRSIKRPMESSPAETEVFNHFKQCQPKDGKMTWLKLAAFFGKEKQEIEKLENHGDVLYPTMD